MMSIFFLGTCSQAYTPSMHNKETSIIMRPCNSTGYTISMYFFKVEVTLESDTTTLINSTVPLKEKEKGEFEVRLVMCCPGTIHSSQLIYSCCSDGM